MMNIPRVRRFTAMLRTIVLLFFGFVIVEMALLITLGRSLGVLPTILLVLGAGFAGAWLARWQGLRTAMKARSQLAQGVMPTTEVIDGMLIAVAAVLLFIPGVLGDFLGIALLFPPTRAVVRHALVGRLSRHSVVGRFATEAGRPAAEPTLRGDHIIDAQVIETRVVEE